MVSHHDFGKPSRLPLDQSRHERFSQENSQELQGHQQHQQPQKPRESQQQQVPERQQTVELAKLTAEAVLSVMARAGEEGTRTPALIETSIH